MKRREAPSTLMSSAAATGSAIASSSSRSRHPAEGISLSEKRHWPGTLVRTGPSAMTIPFTARASRTSRPRPGGSAAHGDRCDHHLVGLNPTPSPERRFPGTLGSDGGLQLRGSPGEPRPVVAGGRSAEPGECLKESRPAGDFGCPVRFPEIQNESDLRQRWASHALNLALWSRWRATAARSLREIDNRQTMCQPGTHLFEGTLRRSAERDGSIWKESRQGTTIALG